jgi:GNAT superfamily N-acetyltransferase
MTARAGAELLSAPAGFEISTDPARLDAGLIHRWLSEDSYWARGRPRDTQDRAVRGQGLGTALVTAARDHLAPFGLRRLLLATADAHGVYVKLGFEPLAEPGRWMALGAQ